jgi:hypothetical protein
MKKIILFRDIDVGGNYGGEIKQVSPVQIVTIKNKFPLFKGEEQANAIEKIEIEENGFSLVAQKDLYQIGDKAVYIQPDYSLSDISLFDSFIRPGGDERKSRLGSNKRIRAVKFNLHTGDNEPVYSVGILLPIDDVAQYLSETQNKVKGLIRDDLTIYPFKEHKWLTETLGITKWEEPENTGGGLKVNGGKYYPSGIYKTDETNCNNLWGHLENKVGYPVTLIGTHKVDGSSISIIVDTKTKKIEVGSRTFIKPEKITKVNGRRTPTFFERILLFFGYKPNLLIKEEVENDDQFVVLAKPYIDKIKKGLNNGLFEKSFILRGEACGQSWKGSGNKNNPNSKDEPQIYFYGVDDYSENVSIKHDEYTFNLYMSILGFKRCTIIFNKIFKSKEEILTECKQYFKHNMIEGIIVRTLDNKFSAKIMNDEYDSKK